MRIYRLMVAAGAIAISLSVAAPALAQGRGNGNGNGSGTQSCPNDAFPATLSFHANDGFGPAIMASNGGELTASVNYGGNVATRLETSDPELFPLPIVLDFPASSGYEGQVPAIIDPHLSTWVFPEGSVDLQALPCQMFDMIVDDTEGVDPPLYRMRLTLQWREQNGAPVPWESKNWDQRWVLRYRPHKPEHPVTWVDAVRTSNDTWVLASRLNSQPPHFAHLEKSGTGNGKNKVPAEHWTPVMPVKIVITVNCDLGAGEQCAETGDGSE